VMRNRQVPGKPAYTCVRTWRMMLPPCPRARSTFGPRVHAVISIAMLIAACHRQPNVTQPIPAPRVERRAVALENGLIALQVAMPFASGVRVPTVIGLGDLEEQLIDAGMASVTYRIDWSTRADAPLPMQPFAAGAGRWLLASPSPGRLGERW